MTPSQEPAYAVPFVVERLQEPRRYRLVNRSEERVRGVSLMLFGSGMMPASLPALLDPGDALEVTIAGADLSQNTVLVVRWFRLSGEEYLWRVSF